MKFLVCFLELRIGHMSVDLSRGDRRMTEKFLDYTYVSTICQKSCRKTMTKSMCMHILEDTSTQSIRLHHIRDEEAGETDRLIFEQGRLDILI